MQRMRRGIAVCAPAASSAGCLSAAAALALTSTRTMQKTSAAGGIEQKGNGKTGGQEKKSSKVVRSGFEKDVKKGRAAPRPYLTLKPGVNDLGKGTSIGFYSQAFSQDSREILENLKEEVAWEQQEIRVMGRKVLQPRLVAYMAEDESLSYTYSHTKQKAQPWSPTVKEIKAKLEELTGGTFNSCLLNLYRNGQDSLSWHSDNEKPYGPNPTIGSVSFGCYRDFLLRSNADHSLKYKVRLGGKGDVLLMTGTCQRDWQHSVPKRSDASGARVNLTFRKIVNPERSIA